MVQLTHFAPAQNGRHFVDDIFRRIFVIKMLLKFVPRGPIYNKQALVWFTQWLGAEWATFCVLVLHNPYIIAVELRICVQETGIKGRDK